MPPWPEKQQPRRERLVGFVSHAALASLEFRKVPVLWRPALEVGARLRGPAILEQLDSTTLLPPDWVASVDHHFNLILECL